MKKASNKYAGYCDSCGTRTESGEGVYLARTLVCAACLQTVADDLATNKGRMVHPSRVPSRLLKWAIRENGLVGRDRMKDLAREWAEKRLLGELFG